jgi:TRAP-type mannitol/chloroaromatic compound transport system substrate-binding protein
MQRRNLLKAGAVGLATSTLAAPAIAQGRMEWNMVMPWPRGTPGLAVNAQRFADRVEAMSDGRLVIKVFGAGELVPPFETLDAIQRGVADIAHGTPYYWVGKSKALHFFTTTPFGLSADELAAWIHFGGGQELWEDVYADFDIQPFYAGSSGVQAGGWFRQEIQGLDDLRGLKFRIAGLGGDVMQRLGVNVVLLPPGEIGPALLSGAIDAAEWVGPWNDRAFGLYRVAKHYYVPAFHEPGPGLEIILAKSKYDALPRDLQEIIRAAASATAGETLADFTWHNIDAYLPLIEENDVQVHTWPDDIVRALARETWAVLDELAADSPLTGRVHASFMAFLAKAAHYQNDFDRRMHEMRAIAFEER